MNIDTSSNTTNSILQSADMARNASSLQAKSWGRNTSFASQMKTSAKEQNNEQVENTKETEKSEQETSSSKTSDTKKTDKKVDTKSSEKISKDQTSEQQTLQGEISNSEDTPSSQNGQQGQNNQPAYNSLSDQIQAYMSANGVNLNFSNINAMNATSRSQLTGMATSVDYSSIKMSDADAKFFADIVSRTDVSVGNVTDEFQKAMQQGDVKTVQSSAKASLALIEALKESSKTNQPFRIDFDKDVSVILQVDKDGKINANFIPGDKAVENYLRNNIDFLRQRFDEENIAYGDLNYSKRRQKDEREKQNNKENGNE